MDNVISAGELERLYQEFIFAYQAWAMKRQPIFNKVKSEILLLEQYCDQFEAMGNFRKEEWIKYCNARDAWLIGKYNARQLN